MHSSRNFATNDKLDIIAQYHKETQKCKKCGDEQTKSVIFKCVHIKRTMVLKKLKHLQLRKQITLKNYK